MITTRKLNNLIHKELIPIQQIFKAYEYLSQRPSFHFDKKIFNNCVLKTQKLIDITRELSEEVKNGKMAGNHK